MSYQDPKQLRLLAKDEADLAIISAQLQDAIVPVGEMGFRGDDKLFALVANRFRWDVGEVDWTDELGSDEADEEPREAGPFFLRSQCGLRFHGVRRVRHKGIDLTDRGRLLSLLAIWGKGNRVRLEFAENAAVELEVRRIQAVMEDLGQPWITRNRPQHSFEDADGTA